MGQLSMAPWMKRTFIPFPLVWKAASQWGYVVLQQSFVCHRIKRPDMEAVDLMELISTSPNPPPALLLPISSPQNTSPNISTMW